jgi:hypothetical protein
MIVLPGKEGDGGGDAVLAEEQGAEMKEGASGTGGAGAAFSDPPDRGGVVGSTEDGFKGSHLRQGEPELGDVASELKVVDGEVAVGIGVGDEARGNVSRPGVSPEVRRAVGAGEDTAHAAAGGVVCTSPRGEVGDDFANVGGAGAERA